MELQLTTPAILFPAISLLLLAYTNRFLHLAALIRQLHSEYKNSHEALIAAQIGNLRFRIGLIRNMQFCGVASIFACALCMFVLFEGWAALAKAVFSVALLLMMISLFLSMWEIRLSTVALNLHLSDLEHEIKAHRS